MPLNASDSLMSLDGLSFNGHPSSKNNTGFKPSGPTILEEGPMSLDSLSFMANGPRREASFGFGHASTNVEPGAQGTVPDHQPLGGQASFGPNIPGRWSSTFDNDNDNNHPTTTTTNGTPPSPPTTPEAEHPTKTKGPKLRGPPVEPTRTLSPEEDREYTAKLKAWKRQQYGGQSPAQNRTRVPVNLRHQGMQHQNGASPRQMRGEGFYPRAGPATTKTTPAAKKTKATPGHREGASGTPHRTNGAPPTPPMTPSGSPSASPPPQTQASPANAFGVGSGSPNKDRPSPAREGADVFGEKAHTSPSTSKRERAPPAPTSAPATSQKDQKLDSQVVDGERRAKQAKRMMEEVSESEESAPSRPKTKKPVPHTASSVNLTAIPSLDLSMLQGDSATQTALLNSYVDLKTQARETHHKLKTAHGQLKDYIDAKYCFIPIDVSGSLPGGRSRSNSRTSAAGAGPSSPPPATAASTAPSTSTVSGPSEAELEAQRQRLEEQQAEAFRRQQAEEAAQEQAAAAAKAAEDQRKYEDRLRRIQEQNAREEIAKAEAAAQEDRIRRDQEHLAEQQRLAKQQWEFEQQQRVLQTQAELLAQQERDREAQRLALEAQMRLDQDMADASAAEEGLLGSWWYSYSDATPVQTRVEGMFQKHQAWLAGFAGRFPAEWITERQAVLQQRIHAVLAEEARRVQRQAHAEADAKAAAAELQAQRNREANAELARKVKADADAAAATAAATEQARRAEADRRRADRERADREQADRERAAREAKARRNTRVDPREKERFLDDLRRHHANIPALARANPGEYEKARVALSTAWENLKDLKAPIDSTQFPWPTLLAGKMDARIPECLDIILTREQVLDFICPGYQQNGPAFLRASGRRASVRWHPDKFPAVARHFPEEQRQFAADAFTLIQKHLNSIM